MKYYLINIVGLDKEKEEESLSGIYSALDSMGDSCIYCEGFLLATKIDFKKVFKILDKHTSIIDYLYIKQIEDVYTEISNVHIIDWINKIEFIERSKAAEEEYNNRVRTMNNILSSAKKILERGTEGEPKDS